jgi:hypothetical protein
MRENLHVPTEFCRRLHRLGIPLLRLWGSDTINEKAVCRCRAGEDCHSGRVGKHLRTFLKQSVIHTEKDLLDWIADGGNVGISLHFNKPGAPPNPLRMLVFDDDDGTARAWLEERGITSPWIVLGKRGCHVYVLLPDGVPDLLSKYDAFKPNTPKLDVKTSGLIVLPMDNGKRLFVDGEEVTPEVIHLLDRFNSLDGLREWLPKVDPRPVVPGMRERCPLVLHCDEEEVEDQQSNLGDAVESIRSKKNRSKIAAPLTLSRVRPPEGSYHPNYAGIPYYERRKLAREHALKVLPSIPGKDPLGRLVKVVNDSIHHYGMSDWTTWETVRDKFNPRCRHTDGSRYPWKRTSVVMTIEWAHQEGRYSTMAKLDKLADPQAVVARLKKKGKEANARRKYRAKAVLEQVLMMLEETMLEHGYLWRSSFADEVRPCSCLLEGGMKFGDVYHELESLLEAKDMPVPSEKVVGGWLRSLGLKTYKGQIVRSREEMEISYKAG